MLKRAYHWFDRNVLELGRELRLSYLPPLMVYLAAGVSGLTAISRDLLPPRITSAPRQSS